MAGKEETSHTEGIRELLEITKCCICTKTVKDPRVLPCVHAFCLKCLETRIANSDSTTASIIVCPLCKSEFMIPETGFAGLQKNFFIERLATICEALNKSVGVNVCDSCCETVNPSDATDTAKAYCMECDLTICSKCCKQHRGSKLTKTHKLYNLQNIQTANDLAEEISPSFCDQHQNEHLKLYCIECNIILCALCYIELHQGHKWMYLDKAADKFRCEMKTNINYLLDSNMTKRLEDLEIDKLDFRQKIERIREKTQRARIQLKDLVDKQAEAILSKIDSLNRQRLIYLQSEHDEFLRVKNMLERFRNYCENITAKGSLSDICRSVGDLRMNFADLKKLKESTAERKIQKCLIPFQESVFLEVLNSDDYNFFGKIHGNLAAITTSEQEYETISSFRKSARPRNYKETEQVQYEITEDSDQHILNVADSSSQESKYHEHIIKKEREEWETIAKLLNDKVNKKESEIEIIKRSLNQLKQNLEDTQHRLKEIEDDRNSLLKQVEELKTNHAKEIGLTERIAREIKVDTKDHLLEHHTRRLQASKNKIEETFHTTEPVLIHTLRTKAAIGVTILNNELLIVSQENCDMEVYDLVTFRLIRRVHLGGLVGPQDVASCNKNICIYILSLKQKGQNQKIVRFSPSGQLLKAWGTGKNYGRLSVANDSNVILAVYNGYKLQEYTADGQLIREIKLSMYAGVFHTHYAIKFGNGNFLVAHGSKDDFLHRICLVDPNGKVLNSFVGEECIAEGHINEVVHTTVASDGCVIVADFTLGAILLLDPTLQFKKQLISKKHHLQGPYWSHLDESTGRLFLADSDRDGRNGKVLVFEISSKV